jgi:hypothetical protein
MGYLRAFVTLLVIAHHAVLAYHPYAPPPVHDPEAWAQKAWGAFPVVDAAKWSGVELFVGYNDTFFMSLMFFVSGLFVWSSLRRKGAASFVRARARRLGVPFALSALVLAPLAYYPAFLQVGDGGSFAHAWWSLSSWPAGPAWFLWVLLGFDLVAAVLTRVAPAWGDALGRAAAKVQRPAAFFGAMIAVGTVAYLPLASVVDPLAWGSFGPFFVQTSRVLHYAAWFFAGAGVGAFGVDRGLLEPGGRLARRWGRWIGLSLAAYAVEMVLVVLIFSAIGKGQAPSKVLLTTANVGFVVTCAASCMAFLAIFVRFAKPSRAWDSLSANAYGMYVVHYAIVSWLQYAMLGAHTSGVMKGIVVATAATFLSWAATSVARRTLRFVPWSPAMRSAASPS